MATLENIYAFYSLYANLDDFTPDRGGETAPDLLDRWIFSRLQSVTADVTADLEALNLTRAAKTLGAFVSDDVSNWYVRLTRRRFWKGEMTPDKRSAFFTLFTVLETSLRLLAPFVPFTSEEIHRSLTAWRGKVDDSVHLQDFPEADESQVDTALERKMATAQEAVSQGRAAREVSGIRTRQPLSELRIASSDSRARDLVADATIRDYVAGELNVKQVLAADRPDDFARQSTKANFRALGPRFGKQVPAWAKVIEAMTPGQIAALSTTGSVELEMDGTRAAFAPGEVVVRFDGVGDFAVAGTTSMVTGVNTVIDDDLRAEGMAREIINKVQNLRKKSGLEVSDRIALVITGPGQVQDAVLAHGERIRGETLAVSVAADGDLPYKDTFKMEGHEVGIALERV